VGRSGGTGGGGAAPPKREDHRKRGNGGGGPGSTKKEDHPGSTKNEDHQTRGNAVTQGKGGHAGERGGHAGERQPSDAGDKDSYILEAAEAFVVNPPHIKSSLVTTYWSESASASR